MSPAISHSASGRRPLPRVTITVPSAVFDVFEETKHPRDHGKFASSTGGAASDTVHEKLKNVPRVDADKRRLHVSQVNEYTSDPAEVRIDSLGAHGIKMAGADTTPLAGHSARAAKYSQSELVKVPLDKIHYTQPTVNVGKLKDLAAKYNPSVEDFHTTKGELRKLEAPSVNMYPDGTMVTGDHHRLIAAKLRGDTHAIVRAYTYEHTPKGLQPVKTKKPKSFNDSTWEEGKHHRSHGQFSSGGGGGAPVSAASLFAKKDMSHHVRAGQVLARSLKAHPDNREAYKAAVAKHTATHGEEAGKAFHEAAKAAYRAQANRAAAAPAKQAANERAFSKVESDMRAAVAAHMPKLKADLEKIGGSVTSFTAGAGTPAAGRRFRP